jgi:hypothetical protein
MFPKNTQKTASASSLQGGGSVQGTSNPQRTLSLGGTQPAGGIPLSGGSTGGGTTLGAAVAVDPAAQAAAAKAAADAAKASQLRGNVTSLINSIKDIFNSRYGLIDQAAAEQTGKVNQRFATESQDVATQVEGENQKLGAAHAATGSYDSSYRGNNVDTVTKAGEAQVRDLGIELEEMLAKIGQYVASQKAGIGGEVAGLNATQGRLAETTDLNELTSLRNQIEARMNELQAGQATYNTNAQNRAALEGVAPSKARAQQLRTTLSQIVAGNADPSQKTAIATKLVQNAGLSPEDEQALIRGFQSDLLQKEQTP